MGPFFNDYNGLSMGVDMGQWGNGIVTPQAPIPVKAPTSGGMDYGTPLTVQGAITPAQAGVTGGAAAPAGGKFGNFLSNFANLADGLSGLGQLYIGLKSLGIAKDQLSFSKEAFNKNLANQTKTYNTALEDRIRSRYVTEGRSSADADAYLAKNNL